MTMILTDGHKRASLGFEARASTLDFNFNQYHALIRNAEKSCRKLNHLQWRNKYLEVLDYRLASQLPYMPWAEISWTGISN